MEPFRSSPVPSRSRPAETFACRACGACCRWPGPVRLGEDDIRILADHLGLAEAAFLEQWTTLALDRRSLSLTEKADGSCVFLEGNRCRVYPARPRQCRDFPLGWSFPGVQQECPGARAALGPLGEGP
jgi:hypothetical protein